MHYKIKPYGFGYEAPSTFGVANDWAILDMPILSDLSNVIEFFPQSFIVDIALKPEFYQNDCSIERIINKRSFGITRLYGEGHVQHGESENIKKHSKTHFLDFILIGKGFYLNDHNQWIPFQENSWMIKCLNKQVGESIYRKVFAVQKNSIVLESNSISAGKEYVKGFGDSTYPRYPYGGFFSKQAGLKDVEQIYCFILNQANETGEHTALGLERSSFLFSKGITIPQEYRWGPNRYVFVDPPTEEEQESPIESIHKGRLKLTLTCRGEQAHYQSFFYQEIGSGSVSIFFHYNKG